MNREIPEDLGNDVSRWLEEAARFYGVLVSATARIADDPGNLKKFQDVRVAANTMTGALYGLVKSLEAAQKLGIWVPPERLPPTH